MQQSSAPSGIVPSSLVPAGRAASRHEPEQRRQRRVLLGAIALVLLGHFAFLGGLDALPIGPAPAPAGSAPLTVRTIDAAPAPEAPDTAAAEPAVPPSPSPGAAAAPAPVRPRRAAREPALPRDGPDVRPAAATPAAEAEPWALAAAADAAAAPVATSASGTASPTDSASAASNPVGVADASPAPAASVPPPGPQPFAAATRPTTSDAAPSAAAPPAFAEAAPPSPAASQPLLAPGQRPPPVYRTRLPAPATLRYQVRSGFLRGTGEIRWRREGESYGLALEARIAGLTLLKWSSDGNVDAAGLAPTRFLDQRARRSPQAANFQRAASAGEAGKVSFSGPATEWPLYAGTQDELSWMIQLAGIAAAEPGLLVEGGTISLVVVGARGDARVWNVRFAGRENVETTSGTVHAVKLVRERDGPYDRGYEIWLDPERGYLPAHVTRRDAGGNADFDILLDRVEPGP